MSKKTPNDSETDRLNNIRLDIGRVKLTKRPTDKKKEKIEQRHNKTSRQTDRLNNV
jgi:hypothetical protein